MNAPFFKEGILFTVALTGGIASGKSTVCSLLEEKGANILDSDLLAREVVKKGEPAWQEIVDHFGKEILGAKGEIERQKLADIVFNDHRERSFLNSVTHPRIFQLMADKLREMENQSDSQKIVILDIPLLIEANASGLFDYTLVVDASPETQVERLIMDRGSSAEEAWARIRSQAPRPERLQFADFVIINEGNLEDLKLEVDRAWESILRKMG
jgi:dephospho-CoA kinase